MNCLHRVLQTANLFRERQYEWIPSVDLEVAGGRNAWRTRVSDCRLHLAMRIDNRQTRRADDSILSEYRYVPEAAQDMEF